MNAACVFGLILGITFSCIAQDSQGAAPKRDLNAENDVAAKFTSLRQSAKLPVYTRLNGLNFAKAACKAARDDIPEEQRFENSDSLAFIYSAGDPESSDTLNYISTRPWKRVRHLVVGVCHARTSSFPEGHYWVAIGLVGNKWDKFVTEMLGKPSK